MLLPLHLLTATDKMETPVIVESSAGKKHLMPAVLVLLTGLQNLESPFL